MQEGSILDGWGAWVDFSRENTLGHSLYPLAAQRQGECLLRDWQWYHQALRKFYSWVQTATLCQAEFVVR